MLKNLYNVLLTLMLVICSNFNLIANPGCGGVDSANSHCPINTKNTDSEPCEIVNSQKNVKSLEEELKSPKHTIISLSCALVFVAFTVFFAFCSNSKSCSHGT